MSKGGGVANIESLSITSNGTYTASGDVDGYSPVTVNVQPTLGTKSVTANGTYTASADNLDGYSSVAVNVDTAFYPESSYTLDSVTAVEGDTMRVLPVAGTQYYPYIYVAGIPYPTPEGAVTEAFGKQYNGQSQEYSLTVWVDLINLSTGESVSGYPQKLVNNWNVSIVNGGYFRIKSWCLNSANSAISVTTTRYNPSYTKPIDDVHTGTTVTDYMSAYVSGPYKIISGVENPQE